MRGAARKWCPAEPDDLMRGSASDGRSLVHYGLLAGRSPHPSASRPPSPSGKALVRTVYHKKVQLFKLVLRKQSLPRGGRWAGRSPGRMRATYRKHSAVYQRTPSPAEPRKKRLTNPLVSCIIIAKKGAVAFPTASQTTMKVYQNLMNNLSGCQTDTKQNAVTI